MILSLAETHQRLSRLASMPLVRPAVVNLGGPIMDIDDLVAKEFVVGLNSFQKFVLDNRLQGFGPEEIARHGNCSRNKVQRALCSMQKRWKAVV
jgi:hypothetical protein